MVHSYASQYPSSSTVDLKIVQFFEMFYETSDVNTAEAHDKYVSMFKQDATFILASRASKGHDEILAARKAMWTHISKRQHTPVKVFPFGPDTTELMLYGVVAYELKDGRKAEVDWAAHAKLVKEDERWKFAFYQVYLDTEAQQNAK